MTRDCRELISIQVGQAGNQVGSAFWDALRQEHWIGPENNALKPDIEEKKDKISGTDEDPLYTQEDLEECRNVYFNEAKENSRYIPRALCVDLEPGTIGMIRSCGLSKFFSDDSIILGSAGAGNNWAKGHYTEGAELIELAMEGLRKETERCEVLSGFQLLHSVGGGTGSGMGTLILLKMRDEYPDKICSSYSVYPSPNVSDTVVEPYNATLSTHMLLENCDQTFLLDNEALFDIGTKLLKMDTVNFRAFNYIISRVMLGITSSLRFPGSSNIDLRKLSVNLVPFPRLHFFQMGEAPLLAPKSMASLNLSVQELVAQSFSGNNYFSKVHPDGKHLACALIFRGDCAAYDIDEQLRKRQLKIAEQFVEWIPNNLKSASVFVPSLTSHRSSTFISNTTSIKSLFGRMSNHFSKLFKRKAFLHWYMEEGMDTDEFSEAIKNVQDLITEYQDKEQAVYDEDAEDDEDLDSEEY